MKAHGRFQKAKPGPMKISSPAPKLNLKKNLAFSRTEIGLSLAPSNRKVARSFTRGRSKATCPTPSNSNRILSKSNGRHVQGSSNSFLKSIARNSSEKKLPGEK